MKYNVAQLLLENLGATRYFDVDEPPARIDDDVEAVRPFVGRAKLTRTNRGILADATVKTVIALDCSRCLEVAEVPIEVRFVEEFYPTVDLQTGLPVDAPPGGTGFMLTEAHEVDLFEPVRQFVLLELPMKPLCRAECLGLCPQCGQNRNAGACSCVEEPSDPRLGQLAEWLRANRLH